MRAIFVRIDLVFRPTPAWNKGNTYVGSKTSVQWCEEENYWHECMHKFANVTNIYLLARGHFWKKWYISWKFLRTARGRYFSFRSLRKLAFECLKNECVLLTGNRSFGAQQNFVHMILHIAKLPTRSREQLGSVVWLFRHKAAKCSDADSNVVKLRIPAFLRSFVDTFGNAWACSEPYKLITH